MLKKLFLLALILSASTANSQTIYETINSTHLSEERELKIQLPRNYNSNTKKTYPVIVVLDGDYLFEPMAGNVDYYSYWDDIPEALVIGINQVEKRENDSFYDEQKFLPFSTGADFFDFVSLELLPYIKDNYRTANFVVIAGHDLTANFTNYFLLKSNPLFNAYINLSPDFAPEMTERVYNALKRTSSKKWYYLATASEDIEDLKETTLQLDEELQLVENENLSYSFNYFEDANHYSMVSRAIPASLEAIFKSYRPITNKEYSNEIVDSDNSPFDYLTQKYQTIKKYFDIDIPVRVNDYLAIGKALEKNQNWKDLEKLGNLAKKHHPQSMLGIYFLARSYEESGESQKAMRTYKSAYDKEEVAFITVDFMLQKADLIKEDFGY